MKNKLKHFLLLTASTLIMAVGVYFFKFANNFTFGGITGLAVLIAKTGVMSAGDFTFITNMLLLILALSSSEVNSPRKQLTAASFYQSRSPHWNVFSQCRIRLPISRCSNFALRSHFRHSDPQFYSISALPAAAPISSQ